MRFKNIIVFLTILLGILACSSKNEEQKTIIFEEVEDDVIVDIVEKDYKYDTVLAFVGELIDCVDLVSDEFSHSSSHQITYRVLVDVSNNNSNKMSFVYSSEWGSSVLTSFNT